MTLLPGCDSLPYNVGQQQPVRTHWQCTGCLCDQTFMLNPMHGCGLQWSSAWTYGQVGISWEGRYWGHLLGRGPAALLRPPEVTPAAFLASDTLASRAGLAPAAGPSASGLLSRTDSLRPDDALAAGRGNLADGSCANCLLASMALAAAPTDDFLAKRLPPLLDTRARFCTKNYCQRS